MRFLQRLSVLFVLSLVGFSNYALAQQKDVVSTYDLQVEYFTNPIGIEEQAPRLSWKLNSSQRDMRQEAYEVQVSKTVDFSNLVWDTGKTNTDQSIHINYKGPELESRQRYYWRVQVWDNHGKQSRWSEPAYWEMGLLDTSEWQAKWIEPAFQQSIKKRTPSPMMRKQFSLKDQIESVRAYVTSHGLYEMKINGQKVGDQVFTPGWTSYNKRLQYQTYEVTNLVTSGDNAVGVTLGDGWYRGRIGFNGQRNVYGATLGLLAQIEVRYANGETEVIATDGSWKADTGPILMSDIYDGETYDARKEKSGWTTVEYDDSRWQEVKVADHPKDLLVAPEAPPVKKIQELRPVEIRTTPEGDTVVDLGQNMVGWIKMNVEGSAGTEVTLTHAEVLDDEGNFYTENLRDAAQKVRYILKGDGEETYEPHFTFQGFRYVKVEGYPGELTKDDITGVVIHSAMDPTGHLETSNHLINRLQHNIVWGQKGNFLDVPTDCPQRDERLGWTGDIQVFSQTACYNMNSAGFLTKWLRDLKADQLESGNVPHVVPNVWNDGAAGASGWADASVIVPWTLYQAYGDVQILETQYESMKGWVEYMRKRAKADSTAFLWDNNFTFGDWLSYSSTLSDYPGAYTDKKLISSAYFARSTDLLQRSAEILGKENDAAEYAALLKKIEQAFQHHYLTPSGRIMSNTQTSYLLALQFGLLPEEQVDEAVQYLLARINARGHLTTGFLGTPHLNPILSDHQHNAQAYELMLRNEYPSWLYPVTKGATTIWERWDGIKTDGSFQNPGMNSFNHYAYGAIGEWLYRTAAGIEKDRPGYKEITIAPIPGGKLSYTRSFINSMYGKIESGWEFNEGTFTLHVEIPENTEAAVILPNGDGKSVKEGNKPLGTRNGIHRIVKNGKDLKIELGSGQYRFSYAAGDLMPEEPQEESSVSLSADTELAKLLANRQARLILQDQLPILTDSPWLSQVMNYTLRHAARSLPEEYQISAATVDKIDKELKAIE